jgi:hypothetical protein
MAGAGYDISASASESNPLTQSSPYNIQNGGGLKPYVVIILAALALVALVVWKKRR